jgi:hypothetical protein
LAELWNAGQGNVKDVKDQEERWSQNNLIYAALDSDGVFLQ